MLEFRGAGLISESYMIRGEAEPAVIDVTLREGERAPGIYYSAERKIEIARLLAELGIEWIELGNPSTDPALDVAITKAVRANVGATIGATARPRLDEVKCAVGCGRPLVDVAYRIARASPRTVRAE
jgi:homocitrate synthase NifV